MDTMDIIDKIYRVFFLLKWTIFCVFHLILAVGLVFLLWVFQASPHQVLAGVISCSQALHLTNVFAVLGVLGLSSGTLLFFYVKIWNRIFAAWSTSFMFKEYVKERGK